MKILTFTYTKSDGTKSFRTLVVQVEPNKMYEGTDISSLEGVDQVMYAQEVNAIQLEFMQKMQQLKADYDVQDNYRRFDPAKMSGTEMKML